MRRRADRKWREGNDTGATAAPGIVDSPIAAIGQPRARLGVPPAGRAPPIGIAYSGSWHTAVDHFDETTASALVTSLSAAGPKRPCAF